MIRPETNEEPTKNICLNHEHEKAEKNKIDSTNLLATLPATSDTIAAAANFSERATITEISKAYMSLIDCEMEYTRNIRRCPIHQQLRNQ
jgi:hypothetical protein